jgi:dUTP pyrophosphatase
MIIPGRTVLSRQIICGILSSKHQMQPCGIDLSLKRVLGWKSAGVIDFDNVYRKTSATAEIPFQKAAPLQSQGEESLHLAPGAYLIKFNETVDTPLDAMGQLFVRSSLFRSGALVNAGVMDAGYQGAIGELIILAIPDHTIEEVYHKGAMLQVVNPFGLTIYKNAKLAQFVFHELKD